MMMRRAGSGRAGFSLVELTVILVILGLLFGGIMMLGDKWTEVESQKTIGLQVKTAENALHNFVRLNNRLPCPADPTLTATDANFGREMRDGSSGCDDSGGVKEFPGAGSDNVAKGALPFMTLNLTAAQMYDESGTMKQYYVDETMTLEDATIRDVDPADLDDVGGIVIQDASGATRAHATYALVSYGTEVNESTATGYEAENQSDDAVLVQATQHKEFDDVVVFGTFRQLSAKISPTIDSAMGDTNPTSGNYDWDIGAWGACNAATSTWGPWGVWQDCDATPTYSYGAWGSCSASPTWSYGAWGSCSANPYYSYGAWGTCSANPYWGSYGSWSSCSGGSCSCSWGSQYKQWTSGDTLAYYGGSCPSCPGGYAGCCGCWKTSYNGEYQTTARNWRSCGSTSGSGGSGYCCYDRYRRDKTCTTSSYGTRYRYRSCYGTSGTQTRSYSCVNRNGTQTRSASCVNTSGTQNRGYSCVNTGGTEYRYRTCNRPTGTQTRTVVCRDQETNVVVDDSYCTGPKPDTSQDCPSAMCPGSDTDTQPCTKACTGTPATSQNCTESCSGSPVTSQSCTESCSGSPYTSRSCSESCSGSSSQSGSCSPSC